MKNEHRVAAAGLLVIAVLWGGSFVLVKQVVDSVDIETFLAARFTIAALLFTLFMRRSSFDRGTMLKGTAVGAALAAGYWLQTTGLQWTTPTKSAFLTSLSVIFVPAIDLLAGRRNVARKVILAALVAFVGTFLMVEGWKESLSVGDTLTIFCALAFAGHLVLATRFSRASDPATLAFLQVAVVALVMMPFAEISTLRSLQPRSWMVIIGTAAVNTTLSFFILMWAQRRTSASEAVVLLSVEPVAAAALGVLLGSEQLTLAAVTGGVLILVAIFLAERSSESTG